MSIRHITTVASYLNVDFFLVASTVSSGLMVCVVCELDVDEHITVFVWQDIIQDIITEL